MTRLVVLCALCLACVGSLRAETIGGTRTGEALRQFLRTRYRPTSALTYDGARQRMFGSLDNVNGKVRCVYTGREIATTGIPNGNIMNTEHTWPQSKFDERAPMKADLHHLFPTLNKPNGIRSNLPFGEVPDGTAVWWRSNERQTQRPAASEINQFSESAPTKFEPREDHKGNVARAMFYFWTIYRDDDITANFIIPQLSTLAQWHAQDPADNAERGRSLKIKAIQGNENPFVADPTLVARLLAAPLPASGPAATAAAPADAARAAAEARASGPMVVRVVDVGAGLCCVVITPDGRYMLFDAGNFRDRGVTAMTAIEELIPLGSTIDLVVLSHGDADHLAAVPFVCENYQVKEIWRDGLPRDTNLWRATNTAIAREVADDGCVERNLQTAMISPGHTLQLGPAVITFLCGFGQIPPEWPPLSGPENVNARSIVVRVDYGASSILFGGDTVGRHIDNPANVCIAAEAFLVANRTRVPIDVDVVIAPHHGADNGSSTAFVQATSPRFVVFSAGSDHHHPHRSAANRYLQAGVPRQSMFRTDRGDSEGTPEWESQSGAPDPIGDDDLEIRLSRNGRISITHQPALDGLVVHARGVAPAAADIPVLGRLSPQVRKWAENDELWSDLKENLEAHTESAALAPATPGGAKTYSPGGPTTMQCPIASTVICPPVQRCYPVRRLRRCR